MELLPGALYHAPHDWMHHVIDETGAGRRYGPFYFTTYSTRPSVWAASVWAPLWKIEFQSIGDGAKQLRELGNSWAPLLWTLHRRGLLLADKVRAIKSREREFPFSVPAKALGGFTLLDEHTMLACPAVSNPFPESSPRFLENRIDPPSSAYLKLQEALVRLDFFPGQGHRCLDAGACPGGWTWVLAKAGAQVDAVDRSPLDPRLDTWPNISFRPGNAFNTIPTQADAYDIICSDVICYPEALWDWFCKLKENQAAKRYVLTIKMQGEPDKATIDQFRGVEGGEVYHGSYNKHELTFIWPRRNYS